MNLMMINRQYRILLLLLILTVIIMTGCGSDPKSDCSAPSDASIKVTGPGPSTVSSDTAFDFTVVVLYKDATPMPQACLTIRSAFAYPRNVAAIGWLYQFYAYPGGLQTVGNIPVDNGFSAKTDDFGQYTFSAQYTAGTGSFKDTVVVRSGAVMGTADFEIQ